MSTRAYKLIEIKHADNPTFNCWHDERIMKLVNQDDGDIIQIQKEDAELELFEVLKEIEEEQPTKDEELEYIANCLRQIIADCGDEDYAEYYCF